MEACLRALAAAKGRCARWMFRAPPPVPRGAAVAPRGSPLETNAGELGTSSTNQYWNMATPAAYVRCVRYEVAQLPASPSPPLVAMHDSAFLAADSVPAIAGGAAGAGRLRNHASNSALDISLSSLRSSS